MKFKDENGQEWESVGSECGYYDAKKKSTHAVYPQSRAKADAGHIAGIPRHCA